MSSPNLDAAVHKFSNNNYDGELFVNQTSAPADVDGALEHFGEREEARVTRERGPGFVQKAKRVGATALAIAGIGAVGYAGKEVLETSLQPERAPVVLTQEQQQAVLDRSAQNQAIEQAQAESQNTPGNPQTP